VPADGVRESESGAADARTAVAEGGSARDWLSVYLKGIAMGAADTVPGVSGGTIALITGIYERLIDALTGLDPRALGHLPRLHRPGGRRGLLEDLRAMDVGFLVVLGLGALTSLLVLSRLAHGALLSYRAETYAFFFGLIAASAVVLYAQFQLGSLRQVGAGLAGFGLAFLLAGASSNGFLPSALPVIFLIGALTITATILPGVSGAFVLVLLGKYEFLTGVLTDFVDAVIGVPTAGVTAALVDTGAVVVVFGIGAVVGLLTIAHVIRWALEHFRRGTLVFLVSLMVGSLRLPVAEVRSSLAGWSVTAAGGVVLAAAVGAAAVLVLDRYTADLEYA